MDRPLSDIRVPDMKRYLFGSYAAVCRRGIAATNVEVPSEGGDLRRIVSTPGDPSFDHSSVNRRRALVAPDRKSCEERNIIHGRRLITTSCCRTLAPARPSVSGSLLGPFQRSIGSWFFSSLSGFERNGRKVTKPPLKDRASQLQHYELYQHCS
jgi:hypothetical protein